MPQALEKCKSNLLAKWSKDPASRPAPREKGQKPEEQAFAICSASLKRTGALESTEAWLLGDGFGPTLIGAAATNRPYIPKLEEVKIVEEGEGESAKKYIVAHLANPGYYNHPLGAFTLNRAVFNNMIANSKAGVIGQKECYDARHKPNEGALGWLEDLWVDEQARLFGKFDPTPLGLEMIGGKVFRYSSMEFHRDYKRDDVKLDLERAEEICLDCVPLEDESEVGMEGENGNEKVVQLEKELQDAKAQLLELEQLRRERLELEQKAFDARVESVLTLAQAHKDKDGNGHPKPLLEWLAAVLKFGAVGEDGAIKLSDDAKPDNAVREYLLSACEHLVKTMPGTVPLERHSSGGNETQEKDDEYDFSSEWK